MDAHYHKVMKARDAITEKGSKLYFAYSGVLDRIAFNQWKTEHSYNFFELPEGQIAELKDMDLIYDFPSRWWGGRVAGLTAKQGSSIFGRVFEVSAKDWPVVQHKEGVITGMSIEVPVKVWVNGKCLEALAFTTSPQRASIMGDVSSEYVEALVRGASQSGLPQDYIKSLTTRGQ